MVPIPSLEKQKEIVQEKEKDLLIVNLSKKSLDLLKEKQQKFLNNL
jgi:restriction endonuclease S subunit